MKTIFFLAAFLSIVCSISFAQTRPRDREPVPNYEVPYEPDCHEIYQSQYEYGYRLGKMYALRGDKTTYQTIMDNTIETRNNSTGDFMFYENQILGMTAGWEDNIIAAGVGSSKKGVVKVKEAMSAPFGGSMSAYRQAAGNPYYWSAGSGAPRKYYWRLSWDLNSFGIQLAKIHLH